MFPWHQQHTGTRYILRIFRMKNTWIYCHFLLSFELFDSFFWLWPYYLIWIYSYSSFKLGIFEKNSNFTKWGDLLTYKSEFLLFSKNVKNMKNICSSSREKKLWNFFRKKKWCVDCDFILYETSCAKLLIYDGNNSDCFDRWHLQKYWLLQKRRSEVPSWVQRALSTFALNCPAIFPRGL